MFLNSRYRRQTYIVATLISLCLILSSCFFMQIFTNSLREHQQTTVQHVALSLHRQIQSMSTVNAEQIESLLMQFAGLAHIQRLVVTNSLGRQILGVQATKGKHFQPIAESVVIKPPQTEPGALSRATDITLESKPHLLNVWYRCRQCDNTDAPDLWILVQADTRPLEEKQWNLFATLFLYCALMLFLLLDAYTWLMDRHHTTLLKKHLTRTTF